MSNYISVASDRRGRAVSGLATWMQIYLRRAVVFDFAIAGVSSAITLQVRFGGNVTIRYAALSLGFPLLWVLVLWLSRAYDDRYAGIGSDEFRKVLNAGISLTTGLAILSYAVGAQLSRAYLLLTVPCVTVSDLIARCALRTTVRPIAGLTLVPVDYPRLSGPRRALKEIFDRLVAGIALFIQTRAGKGGPALPDEAAEYADHVRRRLTVKPSLTGLRQVNGRSGPSRGESVRPELRYVENWSIALDLRILWKMFSGIFGGSGAY